MPYLPPTRFSFDYNNLALFKTQNNAFKRSRTALTLELKIKPIHKNSTLSKIAQVLIMQLNGEC